MKNLMRKRGRPKVEASEAKGTFFAARFDEAETKRLNKAIDKSGKTKSNWIRKKLLAGI